MITGAGDIRVARRYYACRRCKLSATPWDHWAGLERGHLSLHARRLAVLAGTSWSFDTASARLKEFCGLRLSDQTLRRETEAAGKKVGVWQQTAAESVESFHQAQGWKEFYTDGTCVNTREGWREMRAAVFLTVLHRLFDPGSDRAAEVWRKGYAIEGAGELQLHHLYRAMAWLGEALPDDQQFGATPFAARRTKDLIEEALFARRQDLFSGLDLVFFDTTSIYFEGRGGETIGQYGKSKDHRPDRKQMVVGA